MDPTLQMKQSVQWSFQPHNPRLTEPAWGGPLASLMYCLCNVDRVSNFCSENNVQEELSVWFYLHSVLYLPLTSVFFFLTIPLTSVKMKKAGKITLVISCMVVHFTWPSRWMFINKSHTISRPRKSEFISSLFVTSMIMNFHESG